MGTGGRIRCTLKINLSRSERENRELGSSEGDIADFAERDITHLQKDKVSEVRNKISIEFNLFRYRSNQAKGGD